MLETCATCAWRTDRYFCALSPQALEVFDRIAFTNVYPAGSVLFSEGESPRAIHMLCKGTAKISIASHEGKTLITHMLREERQLFPPIETLEIHPHRVRFGSMSRPLLAEFVEHDLVHEWLVRIRELSLRLRSANYPHTDVLDALDSFDRDAHRHMHLENNVLIPRVVEMENRLKTEHEEQRA
jgi:CRP-like cAMP-binding protein